MAKSCNKREQNSDGKSDLGPKCELTSLEKKKKRGKKVNAVIAILCCITIIVVAVWWAFTLFTKDVNVELKEFKASCFDVYINTDELVTFTVKVDSDSSLPNSVDLYEDGSIIASMNDKGKDGDLVASDGIFTAQVSLSKSDISNISYYAGCSGATSNTFEICYYRDITQDEFVSYSQLLNKINLLTFDEAKALVETSDEIVNYDIDENSNQITYKSIYGISGIWEEFDEYTKGNGELAIPAPQGVDYETVYNKILTSMQNNEAHLPLPNYPTSYEYTQARIAATNASVKSAVSNTNTVVLRPFRTSQFTYDDFLYTGQILSESLGGTLTVIDDENVSLSVMKSLDEYGIVLIDTHGGITNKYKKTYIVTGEAFDEISFLLDPIYYATHVGYSADYLADRIFGTGVNRAGVSSKFFDKYYSDNSLDNSFWFLGCCYSFYNDSLADSLLGKGADAVVGFTNPVSVWYCNNILFETVINSMLLSNDSLSAAIKNAENIYGNNDPIEMARNTLTKIKYKGDSSFRLVISDTPTENGTEGNEAKSAILIDKFGLTSQKQFISCLGTEIQTYPSDIYGIVSMVELDINDDAIDELIVLRVSQTDNNYEAQIIAEVYRTFGGNLQLCASQPVYDISFCTASNIYLFYSDMLQEYCIMVDTYSWGSYSAINSWSAKVFALSIDSIEEYGYWKAVPSLGIEDDFELEFRKINVPYAKYCTTFDKRNSAVYYQPMCEVEHELFGDSSTYMTRNHKLKIKSTTDEKEDETLPNTTERNIPSDAFEYNGHYYKIYSDVCDTWEEAEEYCESLGGHLAVISSQEENDAIFSYLISSGYKNAYFGYSDSQEEGNWRWVVENESSYTNWHPNEPNGEQPNEDYAMFYKKYSDGTWNDGIFGRGTSTDDGNFICEWD